MSRQETTPTNTLWLVGFVGLLGAAAVIAQSLYIREMLVAFFGNELTLGVVLGVWLFGVVSGAWVGGKVSRGVVQPMPWLAALAVVGLHTLPGGLMLARALRALAQAHPGSYLPLRWLLIGAVLVTMPFSVLVGLAFPMASRAASEGGKASAAGIALVYIAEGLGAVVGGLVFSMLLIGRVGPFRIAFSAMTLLVWLAVWPGMWHNWRRRRFSKVVLWKVPVLVGLGGTIWAAPVLERAGVLLRWWRTAPGQTLRATTDSPYGNIALGERAGQFNLYLDGHIAASFPDRWTFSHLAHLVLCEHPRPRRVLVVGGGMEGLIAPMLRHDLELLHYVQVDPALPRLLYPFLREEDRRALRDPRVVLFETDGRSFVRSLGAGRCVRLARSARRLRTVPGRGGAPLSLPLPGKNRQHLARELDRLHRLGYDLVFLNVPEPANANLNRFYTVEFLREVKQVLSDGGVLAATLPTAGVNYRGVEALDYTGSFYHTLREVFTEVVVAPDPTIRYFFASNRPEVITSDPALLARRYRQRDIEDPNFHWVQFRGDFPPLRVKRLVADLESHTSVPRNTDQQPITYFFDTILWGRYSHSRIVGAFRIFERLSFWALLAACGLTGVVWAVTGWTGKGRRPPRGRRAAVWAVGTAGFAAMTLEILLLFAYQNLFGTIYKQIALAVALFMAGLTGGGLVGRWLVRRHGGRAWLGAVVVCGGLAGLSAGLPGYLRTVSAGAGAEFWRMGEVLSAMVLTGTLTGALFPLASQLYLQAAQPEGAPVGVGEVGLAAGLVDAADHAGACLGALITGIVLVPILGTGRTSAVLAALMLTALVAILANRPSEPAPGQPDRRPSG